MVRVGGKGGQQIEQVRLSLCNGAILIWADMSPAINRPGNGLDGLISYSLQAGCMATTTRGCLLPYFLPTPMCGAPCNFGHGGRIMEAEADSRPRSTNKQTTAHNCGSSLGAVPSRRDSISSGKPAQSMYMCRQVQYARARLVLRDSLILSMSRDKLPNVHCSRVGHSTPHL